MGTTHRFPSLTIQIQFPSIRWSGVVVVGVTRGPGPVQGGQRGTGLFIGSGPRRLRATHVGTTGVGTRGIVLHLSSHARILISPRGTAPRCIRGLGGHCGVKCSSATGKKEGGVWCRTAKEWEEARGGVGGDYLSGPHVARHRDSFPTYC